MHVAPLPPGAGRGGKAPTSGSSTQRNRAAETFCPLFPPELDSGGLRGRRREERKGREGEEGVRPLCNIIGCRGRAGARRESMPIGGGIKGIKAGAPCLSPHSWGSQPGAAGSEAAGPFAPTKGTHSVNTKVRATQGAAKAGGEKEKGRKKKGEKQPRKKKGKRKRRGKESARSLFL